MALRAQGSGQPVQQRAPMGGSIHRDHPVTTLFSEHSTESDRCRGLADPAFMLSTTIRWWSLTAGPRTRAHNSRRCRSARDSPGLMRPRLTVNKARRHPSRADAAQGAAATQKSDPRTFPGAAHPRDAGGRGRTGGRRLAPVGMKKQEARCSAFCHRGSRPRTLVKGTRSHFTHSDR